YPSPIRGHYPFNEPNEPVKVYSGPLIIDNKVTENCSIEARWLPRQEIRWTTNISAELSEILTLEEKDISFQSKDGHSVRARARIRTTNPLSGWIGKIETGNQNEPMRKLIAYWINATNVIGSDPISAHEPSRERTVRGRSRFSANGYLITMDARRDLSQKIRESKENGGYFISHAMEISRENSEDFTTVDAQELLESLRLAMSFARGSWTSPCLPVGFNANNSIVWQSWSANHAEVYGRGVSWWDPHRSQDLTHFMELYLKVFGNPSLWPTLRFLTQSSIASNTKGFLEQKIITAFSAIENLSWHTYVSSGKRSEQNHKSRGQGKRVRELVNQLNLGLNIPENLVILKNWAKKMELGDAPMAITEIRNRLVHPKEPGEIYDTKGLLTEPFSSWVCRSQPRTGLTKPPLTARSPW